MFQIEKFLMVTKNQEWETKSKKVLYALLVIVFLVIVYNAFQLRQIEGVLTQGTPSTSVGSSRTSSPLLNKGSEGSSIIPKGRPSVYGDELDFSFDDLDPYNQASANQAIEKLSSLDKTLTLEGKNLERYIKILYKDHGGISCEFCCGARAVIFEDGKAACGCAHSFAMRGIAKYLILNHPDLSDQAILEEVGKLKVRFFPTIHEAKAQVMKEKGMNVDYVSLTTNENRGIEKGAAPGSMVGGC